MKFYADVADTIDPEMFKKRVTEAAHKVAAGAAKDINDFVPMRTGALRDSMLVDGRKVRWTEPYAGVLFYGHLFIDPGWVSTAQRPAGGSRGVVGRKGGFPFPNYGPNFFRSRRNVEKVDSGRMLKYRIGTATWIKAATSTHGSKWLDMARRYLLNGK